MANDIRRGWQSTLDRIPAHLKPILIERVEDSSQQQKEILAWLNLELARYFAPEGMLKSALKSKQPAEQLLDKYSAQIKELKIMQISTSALNRYATSTIRRNHQIRDAREAAETVLAGMKEHAKSDLGRAITELIKSLAFDLVHRIGADDDFDEILKRIGKLAIISERVANADKSSTERIAKAKEEAKAEALEEAIKIVDETAKEAGLPADRVAKIKKDFLGIRKTD